MRPHERHDEIVRLVNVLGEVSVDDLAERLDISKETVRRDLQSLDVAGKVHKFHGGARVAGRHAAKEVEGPFAARMQANLNAKRAIAQAAASLLMPGDSLFIDTGSTTIAFAEALVSLKRLTIITNSTRIATIVSAASHKVFLIGGAFGADASETLGSLAIDQLAHFRARYAFLTVGAVEPGGLLDFDEGETQIARTMLDRAETVNVLADSSKFARRGIFEVAPWSRIDRLISDAAPPEATAEAMRAAGTQLMVAAPNT